jgi:hypothetical protein
VFIKEAAEVDFYSERTDPMPCRALTVSLDVAPPSGDSEVSLQLTKTCNPDDTAEWKLHFQLKMKDSTGKLKPVVTLDVNINNQDHSAALATANNGMDANQRAQADVACQTALLKAQGSASDEDVQEQTAAIIPARDPNSPA